MYRGDGWYDLVIKAACRSRTLVASPPPKTDLTRHLVPPSPHVIYIIYISKYPKLGFPTPRLKEFLLYLLFSYQGDPPDQPRFRSPCGVCIWYFGTCIWCLVVCTRGVHISMGKFQSGFLKKHIVFPGCILLPESKYVRVEHFDPGK